MLYSTAHFPILELGGIFPESHHGLFFLGEVVHLHLQGPFALLPWQLLYIILDLWGGN